MATQYSSALRSGDLRRMNLNCTPRESVAGQWRQPGKDFVQGGWWNTADPLRLAHLPIETLYVIGQEHSRYAAVARHRPACSSPILRIKREPDQIRSPASGTEAGICQDSQPPPSPLLSWSLCSVRNCASAA